MDNKCDDLTGLATFGHILWKSESTRSTGEIRWGWLEPWDRNGGGARLAERELATYVDYMASRQILIVAPEDTGTASLAELLRLGGHQVAVAPTAGMAAASVTRDGLDVVVVDLRTAGASPVALAAALTPADVPGTPPPPLEAVEREHILAMLRYTRGNKRRAAQLLGIARSTLIQKVRRYALEVPAEAAEHDLD